MRVCETHLDHFVARAKPSGAAIEALAAPAGNLAEDLGEPLALFDLDEPLFLRELGG